MNCFQEWRCAAILDVNTTRKLGRVSVAFQDGGHDQCTSEVRVKKRLLCRLSCCRCPSRRYCMPVNHIFRTHFRPRPQTPWVARFSNHTSHLFVSLRFPWMIAIRRHWFDCAISGLHTVRRKYVSLTSSWHEPSRWLTTTTLTHPLRKCWVAPSSGFYWKVARYLV